MWHVENVLVHIGDILHQSSTAVTTQQPGENNTV